MSPFFIIFVGMAISVDTKYISLHLWDTTMSGINPYDFVDIPVANFLWIERGAGANLLTSTILSYAGGGTGFTYTLTHDSDPKQKIITGLKNALRNARMGNSAANDVTFSTEGTIVYITDIAFARMP